MVDKKDIRSHRILVIVLAIFGAGFLFSVGLPFWLVAAAVGAAVLFKGGFFKKRKRTKRDKAEQFVTEEVRTEVFVNAKKKRERAPSKVEEQGEDYASLLQYALKIRKKIEKKVKRAAYLKDRLGSEELSAVLDDYLSRISEMVERSEELKTLMNAISVDDTKREITKFKKRLESVNSVSLRAEYEKTIGQYNKHLESYDDLFTQHELLGLRIRQAVVGLEQLQIDCTRAKEVVESEDDYIVREFERRGAELSSYVDNLNGSYQELDREL